MTQVVVHAPMGTGLSLTVCGRLETFQIIRPTEGGLQQHNVTWAGHATTKATAST